MNIVERGRGASTPSSSATRSCRVIFGVMKKFGDDNAGIARQQPGRHRFRVHFPAAAAARHGPGLVLTSHSGLRNDVLHSTLRQFPIIGTDLGSNIKALHRNSAVGLTVGIVGLIWGSLGLAQNGIFTMEQIWNLPGVDRPNYLKRSVPQR